MAKFKTNRTEKLIALATAVSLAIPAIFHYLDSLQQAKAEKHRVQMEVFWNNRIACEEDELQKDTAYHPSKCDP